MAASEIGIYLETGKKLTIGGAIDWPGWCRIGRDEPSALQALLAYAARYAEVVQPAGLAFQVPSTEADLTIVERLSGSANADFGVPALPPAADARPLDAEELARLQTLLEACWSKFDAAAAAAVGRPLRKGPRGGGRELDEIISYVAEAESAYLGRLGLKPDPTEAGDLYLVRQAVLSGLAKAARGETPTHGPRGGQMWSPRYFVRRAAWHILDHAWEIEDRVQAG